MISLPTGPLLFDTGIYIRFSRGENYLWLGEDAGVFQRTVLTAVVAAELYAGTSNNDLRCSQLRETLDDVARCRFDFPIVLAGDLNLDVSRTSASGLFAAAQFRDAFQNDHSPTTSPIRYLQRPRVIDWISTPGPIHATSPTVHSSISASDHYPLSVLCLAARRL